MHSYFKIEVTIVGTQEDFILIVSVCSTVLIVLSVN